MEACGSYIVRERTCPSGIPVAEIPSSLSILTQTL
jgi:hypothetical protein